MRSKKIIGIILGILFSFALITAIFFTSMDIVIYGNMPGSFVDECIRYDVLGDVGITEEELADVSEEMFEYLRGGRDSLADITATIHGQPDTPFFNEKECLHMADCRKLFLAGYSLWRWSAIAAGTILIILLLMFRKELGAALHCLAAGLLAGAGIMAVAAGTLAILVSRNFDKYFTMFHLIFFDNDLWILDVNTDRLLMIMPTGYFVDCVTQIGLIFGISILVLLALAAARLIYERKSTQGETENREDTAVTTGLLQ